MSIDLSDLGLEPVMSAATDSDVETLLNIAPKDSASVEVGSLLARTLYHVWNGDRVTVIESPPGAGKTTLITEVLLRLLIDSNLTIVVACPTRRGAADIASRLVEVLGTEDSAPKVVFSVKGEVTPAGCYTSNPFGRSVIVRTAASCKFGPPEVDLLIFDEAYQVTYSDAVKAASKCQQVLMVGDPGQIGPVITLNAKFWSNSRVDPSSRAPEVFAQMENAVVLNMDATFRVGQQTVDAIAPLYGFPFTSKRPQRHIMENPTTRFEEIEAHRIPRVASRTDLNLMRAVIDHAMSFLGRTVEDHDADGTVATSVIEPADIAIIVPHNDQATLLDAMLRNTLHHALAFPGAAEAVYVGTADRAQGGQWKVVLALDPMIGHVKAGGHQLALGRLCVMLSRHTHHLSWIHESDWNEKFTDIANDPDASAKDSDNAHRSIAVRRIVTSHAKNSFTLDFTPTPAEETN